MKIIGIALIVIMIAAIVFLGFFYFSVRLAREMTATLQATSSAASPAAGPRQAIDLSTTSPAGFHLPTSQPSVHGPSGPPPNY